MIYKTTGEVETVYDSKGNVKGYYVGRRNACRIFLTRFIEEYAVPDQTFTIDKGGSPWVKK